MPKNILILATLIMASAYSTKKETNTVDRDKYGAFVQNKVKVDYYITNIQQSCPNGGPVFNCMGIMVSAFEGGNDWTAPYY